MKTDKNDQVVDDLFNVLSAEELLLTEWSLDIAMRLHDILEAKGMSQRDLAKLMGKQESEVSRWLKGMHNFTMKTIAKLQLALQEPIIQIAALSASGVIKDLPNAGTNTGFTSAPLQKLEVVFMAEIDFTKSEAA